MSESSVERRIPIGGCVFPVGWKMWEILCLLITEDRWKSEENPLFEIAEINQEKYIVACVGKESLSCTSRESLSCSLHQRKIEEMRTPLKL